MSVPDSSTYLLTGGSGRQLLDALRRAMRSATHIDLAVAFIRLSGLNLLIDDLALILKSRQRSLRVLTSDYLNVTDPRALKELLILAEQGADVRVFETGDVPSFHLKAYLFLRSEDQTLVSADAFVGSSNLSKPALTDGLEWNYHLNFPNEADSHASLRINEIRNEIQRLHDQPQVRVLTQTWISEYESRYQLARLVLPRQPVQPEPDEPAPPPPSPLPHQQDALDALANTRRQGRKKGLVVLATGMGKTYLAAFDVAQLGRRRMLFVAHREEILYQAERSFLNVLPDRRIGRFSGQRKDRDCDLLFASVQTLGRKVHLQDFAADYFDYIVIDEFHHAAANSYQRLLAHFQPKFLLGLTATPQRTDGSDILELCDGNLVYERHLYDGIRADQLCPFTYFGIFDASVDYADLPWRNGQFDPSALSVALATKGRARHALKEWKDKAQSRTLAFCVSTKHADYMADYFQRAGVPAASIHSESALTRQEALDALAARKIEVLFSVDLFNEGVDLPTIDTVLMLRPTESKILFLQQLGRGLRRCSGKERLIVLDFVGNHHSFLNRPAALLTAQLGQRPSRHTLIEFTRNPSPFLAPGCSANIDLKFVAFLEQLAADDLEHRYRQLKTALGRRPRLSEFCNRGTSLQSLRRRYGGWWPFVDAMGDASPDELEVLESHSLWLSDLAITHLSKSYKLVLLRTLLDQNAIARSVTVQQLARWALDWFRAHPAWCEDLPQNRRPETVTSTLWQSFWRGNPIRYWCTPERGSKQIWFNQNDLQLQFAERIDPQILPTFMAMTDELLGQRMADYQARRLPQALEGAPNEARSPHERAAGAADGLTRLPYFPDIRIACGHFRTGSAEAMEDVPVEDPSGKLTPSRHFIAQASGRSMEGGKQPIRDGDYLLFEQITATQAGSLHNQIVAIERQDPAGDNQYLLRRILENPDGSTILRAQHADYADLIATDDLKPFARLLRVVSPP